MRPGGTSEPQAMPPSAGTPAGWAFAPAHTRILVIDDEEANREILQRLLEREGFPCTCAATGAEGLRRLADSAPDLVVCDVRLPDTTGLDICRHIKSGADTGHIFVALISSAETSSKSAVDGLGSGADEYIARPIRNEELVARVHALARIQQTSRALRESEQRFITLAKTAPAGIIRTDILGKIVYVNDYWCRLTGISSAEALGADWHAGLHPDDICRLTEAFEQAAAEHRPMKIECRLRNPAGDIRWVLSTASAELDSEDILCGYVGTNIDITERKAAEQELAALNQTLENRVAERTAELARTNGVLRREIAERRRAEDALKQLPHRILDAQESERRRIARDLHDGVSQILASVRFRCQLVIRRLGDDVDPGVLEEMDATHRHLESALREVRNISHNLLPAEIDDLGLIAAVRSLAERYEERTETAVAVDVPAGPKRLSPDIELAAYRILQEALNNVERHAQATRVQVTIRQDDESMTLNIADDGCGFTPAANAGGGLGLVNMRERADFIDGTIAIRSSPRSGTAIELHVPLPD